MELGTRLKPSTPTRSAQALQEKRELERNQEQARLKIGHAIRLGQSAVAVSRVSSSGIYAHVGAAP